MPVMQIELDEVEIAQLQQFCTVNNVSAESAVQAIVHERLEELVYALVFEGVGDGKQLH